MKKSDKIIIVGALTIIIGLTGYVSTFKPTSEYQFGLLIEDNEELLVDRPNYYAANENTNKYSDLSPITLPDSSIEFEIRHLKVERPFHLRKAYEPLDGDFLFTTISSSSNKIESFEITNTIKGEKLTPEAYTIYYIDDPEIYPGAWRPVELDDGFTLEEDLDGETSYTYIERYPFPGGSPGSLSPRPKWFGEAGQILEIEYYNDTGELVSHTYDLTVYWYKFSDIFQTILFAS